MFIPFKPRGATSPDEGIQGQCVIWRTSIYDDTNVICETSGRESESLSEELREMGLVTRAVSFPLRVRSRSLEDEVTLFGILLWGNGISSI